MQDEAKVWKSPKVLMLQAAELTARAETGLSLRVQTGLNNLKKADVQSDDPVFSMCKRSEGRL